MLFYEIHSSVGYSVLNLRDYVSQDHRIWHHFVPGGSIFLDRSNGSEDFFSFESFSMMDGFNCKEQKIDFSHSFKEMSFNCSGCGEVHALCSTDSTDPQINGQLYR
jgi:hypothetical protein